MADELTFELHKYDINISLIEKQKVEDYNNSWIKVKFSGADFNIKILNAIRRVSMINLPTYAIPAELIKIETNTTVAFNNDYMKLRLGFLPILGVDTGLSFLSEKYWNKVNYSDQKRFKHENEKNVEMYINKHNETAQIINVTTNDMTMYVDGEQIKPYSVEYPILIIKLRPDDTFKCTMKATIGVAEGNARWMMARNAWYEMNDDDPEKIYYELTVEGNGQADEHEILIRTCKFILKKLNDIKVEIQNRINAKEIVSEQTIKIKLDGEDHTFGEIINYELQSHKNILYSGVSKTDHLVKSVTLTIRSIDKDSAAIIMVECIDILIKKYSHIGKLVTNMKLKK